MKRALALVALGGLGLMTYGIAMMHLPTALIVLGILLFAVGSTANYDPKARK